MTDAVVQEWRAQVREAASAGTSLRPRGSGSKDFYGRTPRGEVVDTRALAGIVSYEPTELVVTVRCGTRLADLEEALAQNNQALPFEPPWFGPDATVGGCVASGLSGPRRPAVGALRDFVLGASVLDGRGEVLAFGGQVMKNVAGYDVSRLVTGSLGTLGMLLEVSLKVLPRAFSETSVRFALDEAEAIARLNEWGGQPLPISASAWHEGVLSVRLEGAEAAVHAAIVRLGGEVVPQEEAAAYWGALREQQHPWFAPATAGDTALWRLAVPSVAAPLRLDGAQLIEWGGGQRWLLSDAPPDKIRARAADLGGHATLFRGGDRDNEVFHPLAPALMTIHRRLKTAFDPAGVFNPGRFYDGL